MQYKKHHLETIYLPGADFKIIKGQIITRKPRRSDINYIRVESPDGLRWNESSIKEAKETIDKFITYNN